MGDSIYGVVFKEFKMRKDEKEVQEIKFPLLG
jgi:hypothetical protein